MRAFRNGLALYLVLVILAVAGGAAFLFSRLASHGQWVSRHFAFREVARRLAEGVIDEGFMRFSRQLGSPDSSESRWLRRLSGKEIWSLDTRPFLVQENGQDQLGGGLSLGSRCSVRVVDFREVDHRGNPLAPGESLGTLEFAVSVEISERATGRTLGACHFTRHHDFKVVSMVSSRVNSSQRSRYAQNFLLDYLLFCRFGLQEFRDQEGVLLNHPRIRLRLASQSQLPPEKRGKVFFGGTGTTGTADYVFWNVPEAFAGVVPHLPPTPIKRITLDDCLSLFPILADHREALTGLEGVFTIQNEPLVKARYEGELGEVENYARQALLSVAEPPAKNGAPGLEILSEDPALVSDPAYAESTLEGALRQRFLSFVHFRLDPSKLSDDIPGEALTALDDLDRDFPAIPMPAQIPRTDGDLRDFLTGLERFKEQRGTDGLPLISRLDDDFLLAGGQSARDPAPRRSFPRPMFFHSRGSGMVGENDAGFRPFDMVVMRSRRFASAAKLEEVGIYDREKGVLRLQGIVEVQDTVDFSGTPQIQVQGQGIIIARDFRIQAVLRKQTPRDLCVLFANRGGILVDADPREPLEAALIAINQDRSGYVDFARPMNLRGALAVDWLDVHRLPDSGTNLLSYDPLLKHAFPQEDQLQINLSRWISFQRILEGET